MLCHKPKQLERGGRARPRPRRIVISILAATTTEQLAAAYPDASVYRFIPNIPAEVRARRPVLRAGPRAADGPEDEILALLGRAGP